MSSRLVLTEELLTRHKACKDGIVFAKNFNLFGLCLNDVEVKGDFRGYVRWFKFGKPGCKKVRATNQYEFNYEYRTIIDSNDPVIDEIKNSDEDWEECTRDTNGNPLTYKNSDGSSYEYTRDDYGNTLTCKTSNGCLRVYTYDANGNPLTCKTSNGYSYEYTRDPKGNTLTYKDSDGCSYEYTRDDDGNTLTYKNSDGYSYEYTLDANGNTLTYKTSTGTNETYRYETSDEFLVKAFINDRLVLAIKKKINLTHT